MYVSLGQGEYARSTEPVEASFRQQNVEQRAGRCGGGERAAAEIPAVGLAFTDEVRHASRSPARGGYSRTQHREPFHRLDVGAKADTPQRQRARGRAGHGRRGHAAADDHRDESSRGTAATAPDRLLGRRNASSALRYERLDAWEPIAAQRRVRLFGADVRGSAIAAPDRLSQVLDNLLANAIAVAPTGTAVSVSGTPEALHVRDRGPGMSDEDRLRAFDRFWSKGSGSGLGLPIARRLLAADGATLELQAGEDGGLDVELHLRPADNRRAPRACTHGWMGSEARFLTAAVLVAAAPTCPKRRRLRRLSSSAPQTTTAKGASTSRSTGESEPVPKTDWSGGR